MPVHQWFSNTSGTSGTLQFKWYNGTSGSTSGTSGASSGTSVASSGTAGSSWYNGQVTSGTSGSSGSGSSGTSGSSRYSRCCWYTSSGTSQVLQEQAGSTGTRW